MEKSSSRKQYAKNIMSSMGLLGAVAISVVALTTSLKTGERVYRGSLNGQEVTYSEGLRTFNHKEDFNKSVMTVEKNGEFYAYEDSIGETDVDCKKDTESNFKEDELERIVIRSANGEFEKFYHSGKMADWNPASASERYEKSVFREHNKIYNDTREQIREKCRGKY